MNKAQIKAEIRRSACDDEWPWDGLNYDAWIFVRESRFIDEEEAMCDLSRNDLRTFYLIVAEAM